MTTFLHEARVRYGKRPPDDYEIGHRRFIITVSVIICPIAIAYSYGTDNKIGLRLSVCLCVCLSLCLSVCHHSHGRISLSIFTKFDTEV